MTDGTADTDSVSALRSVRELDRSDPLAALRAEFVLPDDRIYLDGNSLGPLPGWVAERLHAVAVQEWGQGLVSSWHTAGWYDMPTRLGDRIGRLIGAGPGQVVVADSTSINLFKVVCAALAMRPGRSEIVSEAGNFPSDLYVLQGVVRLLPEVTVRLVGRDGSLEELLGGNTAVAVLTEVDFRTGRRHPMADVTRCVQDAGALMVWDLAHSAGAFPVDVDGCHVDMAVGCTYKYLNGGPGSPAFVYVARRHQDQALTPLNGWIGHDDPFAFAPDYRPAADIRRFLCGTPAILSYAPLEASLDIWDRVDLDTVRDKSVRLASLFVELVDRLDPAYGLSLVSPRDAAQRGSQVSLRHRHGLAVMRALIERGVVGDFRAPDILRFGLTPLTLRYQDVYDAVRVLAEILETGLWRDMPCERGNTPT